MIGVRNSELLVVSQSAGILDGLNKEVIVDIYLAIKKVIYIRGSLIVYPAFTFSLPFLTILIFLFGSYSFLSA